MSEIPLYKCSTPTRRSGWWAYGLWFRFDSSEFMVKGSGLAPTQLQWGFIHVHDGLVRGLPPWQNGKGGHLGCRKERVQSPKPEPTTLHQVLDTDAANKLVLVAGAHARGAGKAPKALREPPKVRTRHI